MSQLSDNEISITKEQLRYALADALCGLSIDRSSPSHDLRDYDNLYDEDFDRITDEIFDELKD